MLTSSFLVALLLAAPLKTAGPGKALVGAWYQGDTQYLDLTDDGTGRLGMLEMQWKVQTPNTLHLIFKEDGAEKDLTYVLKKGLLKIEVMNREVVLTRGTPKVRPTAAVASDPKKAGKKAEKPPK